MWTRTQKIVFFWSSLFFIGAVAVTIIVQLRNSHGEKGLTTPIPMSEVKAKADANAP